MPITARKVIQLRLLADPENTERHKAQKIGEQVRRELDQSRPQGALVAKLFYHWRMQVEDKQGHSDSEDAVAQRGKPFQTLAGNTVVIDTQCLFPDLDSTMRASATMLHCKRYRWGDARHSAKRAASIDSYEQA